MPMYFCMFHMCAGACGVQRTALESLDLELHTGARCQVGAGSQIPILFLQKQQMLLTTEPPL